jgi:bacterioferritin-associated ferredoxin
MIIDSIKSDPEWKDGNYTTQPRGLRAAVYTLLFMVSSPRQWHKQAPTREAADRFFDEQVQNREARADANDMLYHYDASRDYNPAPALETIAAPLLAINSADDQVNPPELGILEREIRRVKNGRAVVLRKGTTDRAIRRLAREGHTSLRDVAAACLAGTDCGSCRSTILEILLEESRSSEKASFVALGSHPQRLG